jgi:hypothetical protein
MHRHGSFPVMYCPVSSKRQPRCSSCRSIRAASLFNPMRLPPFAVVERIVLTRPRQVSELAIWEQTADPAQPAVSVYLGDLSVERVRAALAPALGDRLEIQMP